MQFRPFNDFILARSPVHCQPQSAVLAPRAVISVISANNFDVFLSLQPTRSHRFSLDILKFLIFYDWQDFSLFFGSTTVKYLIYIRALNERIFAASTAVCCTTCSVRTSNAVPLAPLPMVCASNCEQKESAHLAPFTPSAWKHKNPKNHPAALLAVEGMRKLYFTHYIIKCFAQL